MRFALLALLPALAAQGGKNEAEKLFRDLEKRVAAAKTLRVALTAKLFENDKQAGKFKGSLRLGEGNKARIDLTGEVLEMAVEMKVVAGGGKLKTTVYPAVKATESPLPKKFAATVRTGLNCLGLTASLLLAERAADPRKEAREPDLEKTLRVSGFKLGKETRVGGRAARVLEYKVTLEGGKVTATGTIWLDAQTLLPLKRELSAERQGLTNRIVETYSEFKLAPKAGGKPSR
jgi:hypothetical protein